MTKRLLVDGLHEEEIRVVIAEEQNLLEFDVESNSKKQTKGNIYLAKITRVEPSLQAAFVEYGSARQGFLPFAEVHPDYYQIPVADRQALIEQQQQEAEESEEEERVEEEAAEAENAEAEGEEKESAEIESVGDEAIAEEPRRPKVKRYKVQEVLKKNQVVLIQVLKEERGNKGASVTSYISLPGRYCVLMPNSPKGGGISRKISDPKERKKMKELISSLEVNTGMSVILRTAGTGRKKTEISRDYAYLTKLWNKIRDNTLSSSAPALIYEEANAVTRTLRDLYDSDVSDIVISGEKCVNMAKEFMKMIMPSHVKRIKEYKEEKPIFHEYGIEDQLLKMNDPVVTMPSGGYIVINSTEALISVDVNSGRATGERNVEDTATRTNIEAAQELARQLRLRDLAGLVVIDFIDMMHVRNRKSVERALKDALKSDRAKIQVGRISPFGLLEMSRQRLRPSIAEINMIECPTCRGAGVIRSADSAMMFLTRAIENELSISGDKVSKIIVFASQALGLHFLNNKRKYVSELEEKYGFVLEMRTEELSPAEFKLQVVGEGGETLRAVSSEDREGVAPPSSRGDSGYGKKPKKKSSRGGARKRGGAKKRGDKDEEEVQESDKLESADSDNANDEPKAEDKKKEDKSDKKSRIARGGAKKKVKPKEEKSEAAAEPTDEEKAEKPKAKKKPVRRRRKPKADASEESSEKDAEDSNVRPLADDNANDNSPEDAGKKPAKKPKGWWKKIIE